MLRKSSGSAFKADIALSCNASHLIIGGLRKSSKASQAICHAKKASQTVVVVESPTKAKKIQQFLGDQYKVLASYGHVRDLPPSSGSVLPEDGFFMKWQLVKGGEQRVAEIVSALRAGKTLVLASDPDREGEAIAWHLAEILKERGQLHGVDVKRITFSEISAAAVIAALQAPRTISSDLVDAYLARRSLDYLFGFNLSPVLWRRLPKARSAGRVQSVALRMVCDRETAREEFKPQAYWDVEVELLGPNNQKFIAALSKVNGKSLGVLGLSSQEAADDVVATIKRATFVVQSVDSKKQLVKPKPPFTTSTLQQESSRRLYLSASATMKVAQQLYEEGIITYMRTDGINLSSSAVQELRTVVSDTFGANYVPNKARVYENRAKNAQEAHEAIRPVSPQQTPEAFKGSMEEKSWRLYKLIWQRAMASQMSDAEFQKADLTIADDGRSGLLLRSGASALTFPGFQEVMPPAGRSGAKSAKAGSSDDDDQAQEDEEQQQEQQLGSKRTANDVGTLLQMKAGDVVKVVKVTATPHSTQPPGRYTDASLIKALEEHGIGRPATYASILQTLQARDYVVKSGKALVPTPLGRLLSCFLVHYFPGHVDYSFTAQMEEKLDDVSGGRAPWKGILADFWGPFKQACSSLTNVRMAEVFLTLEQDMEARLFPPREDGSDARRCPSCHTGRLSLKPSSIGTAFIGCSNFDRPADQGGSCDYAAPWCPGDGSTMGMLHTATADLGGDDADKETESAGSSPNGEGAKNSMGTLSSMVRPLGIDPLSGNTVTLRQGPYGWYVQLGEQEFDKAEIGVRNRKKGSTVNASNPKPRRASLPKGAKPEDINLHYALDLLCYPRSLGQHPISGAEILLHKGIKGYGSYVSHAGLNAPLPKTVELHAVTIEIAVDALARKQARGQGRHSHDIGVPNSAGVGTDCDSPKSTDPKKSRKAVYSKPTEKLPSSGRKRNITSRVSNEQSKSSSNRAPSAYIQFMKTRWADIKASEPNATLKVMSPKIAAEWRSMDIKMKEQFLSRATINVEG